MAGLASHFVDFIFTDSVKTYRIFSGPAYGIKMNLNARRQTAFLFGTYEIAPLNLLLKYISSETVFWDIGAQIGYFSCIFSRLLTKGCVVSVEPFPEHLELVREHIRINNLRNVIIIDKALSSVEKSFPFVIARGAHEGKIAHNKEHLNLTVKAVNIEATTMDILINSGVPVPNIVKIDTEGEEGQILKGATLVLQKYQPSFLIEIHDLENAQMCWDILSFYHYNIKFLNNGFLRQAERPQDIDNKHIWAETIK